MRLWQKKLLKDQLRFQKNLNKKIFYYMKVCYHFQLENNNKIHIKIIN